jgi:hypothetical protein
MEYDAPSPSVSRLGQRTSRDALLHRQVRWRLFRAEEMPARLRRLERLERVAERSPELEKPAPPPAP